MASERRRNRMAAGTVKPAHLVDRPVEEGEEGADAGPFVRRPASLDVAHVLPNEIDAELLLHRLRVGVFSSTHCLSIPADEFPNFLLCGDQLLSSNALSASSIALDASGTNSEMSE